MEYCKFGDLQKYISENGKLPEGETCEIITQLTEGLHFMHSEGFAHRDLKPRVNLDLTPYNRYPSRG